jgi:hypothetical protein
VSNGGSRLSSQFLIAPCSFFTVLGEEDELVRCHKGRAWSTCSVPEQSRGSGQDLQGDSVRGKVHQQRTAGSRTGSRSIDCLSPKSFSASQGQTQYSHFLVANTSSPLYYIADADFCCSKSDSSGSMICMPSSARLQKGLLLHWSCLGR